MQAGKEAQSAFGEGERIQFSIGWDVVFAFVRLVEWRWLVRLDKERQLTDRWRLSISVTYGQLRS